MKMKMRIEITVVLVLVGLAAGLDTHAQEPVAELLLPGDEYRLEDLPADAAGTWWVLHDGESGVMLESLSVVVTAFHDECVDDLPREKSGRAVSVPEAEAPIAMLRGFSGLETGTVPTAFVIDGTSGDSASVAFSWAGRAIHLRHVVVGDRYRIELVDGPETYRLHEDDWHGDGIWRVRWIGDLNGDGFVDVLLDASHKYSVHVTRLFLSTSTPEGLTLPEVAAVLHTAC